VNLLIGTKKSADGWNSYRVSTMGLMNVGATEGSQIIQLFGRSVRLMGYGRSPKRSGKTRLPEDVTRHVDPKGIRNIGMGDPKIQFHQTIKEIEQRLGDASVRLQSFIVSNTPSHTMQKLWNIDKPAMGERHILFQEEDQGTYVRSMLEAVGPAGRSRTTDAVPS
jgi:hypothetical protein